jgi:cytochrome c-type biogenesis protein CcmH
MTDPTQQGPGVPGGVPPVPGDGPQAAGVGGPPPEHGPGETTIETPPTAVTVVQTPGRTLVVFGALLLLLLSFVAPANGATPRTTLEAVEAELMCVTCRTPLNQSNARQAQEERDEIERLVSQGKTKQQAVDAMVAIYGTPVLIDPPEEGLRVARVAIPGVAAVLGVTLLVVLVRRWRRRAPADEDPDHPVPADPDVDGSSPDLTDDDRRRLDAELERFA